MLKVEKNEREHCDGGAGKEEQRRIEEIERCGRQGEIDKSRERIIGRRTRESDHGDVDGSSRLNHEDVEGEVGGVSTRNEQVRWREHLGPESVGHPLERERWSMDRMGGNNGAGRSSWCRFYPCVGETRRAEIFPLGSWGGGFEARRLTRGSG